MFLEEKEIDLLLNCRTGLKYKRHYHESHLTTASLVMFGDLLDK